jgi:UDP-glucuronate decarboxylase
MDAIVEQGRDHITSAIDPRPFREKRILVSGGSGFLGSWICDVLSQVGSRITCLDNLSTGALENIQHLRGTRDFEFEEADVCGYSSTKKINMVFHLASRPAPEDYQKHPVQTAQANATGTDNMLDLARRNDARFFYASSSEVYGDPEIFPTVESFEGKVDPLGPRSSYEEGKRFGEALCKAYHDQYGIDVRIGRLFNSYGPRLREDGLYGRVVSRFVKQALLGEDVTVYGDGLQTRSFCYISDTITAVLLLMQIEQLPGYALNLGSTIETSILDLASLIIRLCGSKSRIKFLPFPPGDHRRRMPEISKARSLLSWEPKVTLEHGLSRTIRWIKARSGTLTPTALPY